MARYLMWLLLFVSLNMVGNAQFNYPPTKRVDSVDTYFGVTYRDPYRWLEYLKKPEVETWFKNQADFSNSYLKNISGREKLVTELTEKYYFNTKARYYLCPNGSHFTMWDDTINYFREVNRFIQDVEMKKM